MLLSLGSRTLNLETPVVMGVLNVTPDSFTDGGRYSKPDAAIVHALKMVEQGAALIDIGGESTRPGASPVGLQEELDRVLPVIAAVVARTPVAVSIDTRKPEVMKAAAAAGAVLINDVNALREPGALAAAAASGAGVCLMHMQGDPGTMQLAPQYGEVVTEVREFLATRVAACVSAGIPRDRLVVDPGIGFGKRLEHNLALLAHLHELVTLGVPVLIGVSRKSMLGTLLGRSVEQRLAGGVALVTAAVLAGARIIRSHDVAETVDAVRVAVALRSAGFTAV